MMHKASVDRRNFMQSTATLGAVTFVAGSSLLNCVSRDQKAEKIGVEEVSAVEDLMREHGALNRILLIYDEYIRRIRSKEELNAELLKSSARIIQDFIENYHEKLEEEYIFPRLKKAGKLVDTIDILVAQHRAGRKITETILDISNTSNFKAQSDTFTLETALTNFIKMYRPHEAREDTVIFPEFKTVITQKEYDELGEEFEDKEHKMFGKSGFEGVLSKIAEIEKSLGIYELSKFTPAV